MGVEDILEARARERAMSDFSKNRAELIRFFKDLASNERPIPEKSIQAEIKDVLSPAREALEREMAARDPSDKEGTIRLSVAAFLLERLDKIRRIALERNKAGLFSLYLTLRDQVRAFLAPGYFTSKPDAVVSSYLDLEPLLSAASELCSLEVPSLEDMVSDFKGR